MNTVFIKAPTKTGFLAALQNNIIPSASVVFIEDTKEIYAQGTYYPCISGSDVDTKISTAIANLLDGAPTTFDTLKELADWIADDTNGAAKMLSDITALLTAVAGKQDTITDLAQIGCGYVVCSTASNTYAKNVTISGFTLKAGSMVSVLFLYGFETSGTSLNIYNGSAYTGNIEIFYHGAATEPLVITANTVAILLYDGTHWNIISREPFSRTETSEWVDLGLPSGTLWARKNLGADTSYDYGLYGSWGNTDLYTAAQISTFASISYANTTGGQISANLSLSQDAVNKKLGGRWRMPTSEEWTEMVISCIQAYTTINGKNVVLLTSKYNGNTLILPRPGIFLGSNYYFSNDRAYYWTSTYSSSSRCYAGLIVSAAYGVSEQTRGVGCSYRPVLSQNI